MLSRFRQLVGLKPLMLLGLFRKRDAMEEPLPKPDTNQDTEETVDEKWSEEFVLDFLLLIQAFHHEIG